MNVTRVFQEYYQHHQLSQESPGTIAWIGSIQVFLVMGSAVIGGPMFDRWGGKVIWPAGVVYIVAVMLTSVCKESVLFT